MAGEDEDYGKPLQHPLCGCCRRRVKITRVEIGKTRIIGGKDFTAHTEVVQWLCGCQDLLTYSKCFLCGRCGGCCRCSTSAPERVR
jgi:hypothetical protein